MTDGESKEPGAEGEDGSSLDQTTAPIEHLEEGQEVPPLDETKADMREFLGSLDAPRPRRPSR